MDLALISSDIERQDGVRSAAGRDAEALDAYSRTVIGAEKRVGPAVASVGLARRAPEPCVAAACPSFGAARFGQ